MALSFRPLVLSDVAALSAWVTQLEAWQAYGYSERRSSQMLERALKRSDFLVVAQDKKELLGFAWSQPGGAFGRSGYLRFIAVQPKQLRKGIGTKLLAEVEEFTGAVSNDLFTLASPKNKDAVAFFKGQDYKKVGKLESYSFGTPETIYRKRLESD